MFNCFWLFFVRFFYLFFFRIFSVFDEQVRRSRGERGDRREMDLGCFLELLLALENKQTREGLAYIFRCLDLRGNGYLTAPDIYTFFR